TGGRRAFKRIGAFGRTLGSAPQWKAARWGLAVLVAVNLLGLNAWAWKERAALDNKRAAVRDTLVKSFPGVKVVVDAPLQMERELAALRQSTGASSAGDFEAILSAVSLAVPVNRTVSAVEYAGGEARILGASLSAAEATALDTSLRAQGYASRIEGDTLRVRPQPAQPQGRP
ncbi:MAG: GspL/Epsl periplasmic domain-containing protein, partial [Polynucleobacter sp.]|nr:GspL/Epsl periplasmic domain-containing protein [Polynucleobacter sp.]